MAARTKPYVREENAGTRAICACNRSSLLPYCDGSHQGRGIRPYMEVIEEAGTVAWCGCRRSRRLPYCDGTHAKLPDVTS